MSTLNIEQKKEWAKAVYTRESLNQKETAKKVGVSEKTIGKWVELYKWDKLKANVVISKEQELIRTFAQINELNTVIESREEGKRYANSKEIDTLSKLSAIVKNLEKEMGLSEIISALRQYLLYLRRVDLVKAQEHAELMDGFIKSLLTK